MKWIVRRFVFFQTVVFAGLGMLSCIEEIDVESNFELEGILVVDARLTDKKEQQSIYLSTPFQFQDKEPVPVVGASVTLLDDIGNSTVFEERNPGQYTSTVDLDIVQGRKYQLVIQTMEGERFSSKMIQLPPEQDSMSILANRTINNSGKDGVSIVANSGSPRNESSFLRYEYEEVFQVIAPFHTGVAWDELDDDYFGNDDDGWEVTIKQEQEETRVCYSQNNSKDLILATTETLQNNTLKGFEVRFLDADNYAISHRYSILVKQYRMDAETYNYYTTLKRFSDFESIFSSVQTGALESNLISENSEFKVLGYFDLSNYNEKRIFFGYNEFFPERPLPPYPISCESIGKPALYPPGFHVTVVNGELVVDGTSSSPLIESIRAGLVGYYAENPDYEQGSTDEDPERAPYLTKPLACTDCRALGSNKKPSFWVD